MESIGRHDGDVVMTFSGVNYHEPSPVTAASSPSVPSASYNQLTDYAEGFPPGNAIQNSSFRPSQLRIRASFPLLQIGAVVSAILIFLCDLLAAPRKRYEYALI